MKKSILHCTVLCAMSALPGLSISATEEELNKKIELLEQRLEVVENQAADNSSSPAKSSGSQISNNSFNPAVSVILEGVYASYKNDPEDYALPGYALGGEAELAQAHRLGLERIHGR